MIILGMVRPSDGKKIISYPVFRVDDLRRAPVLGLVVWLVVVVPLGVVGRLLLLVGLPRPAVLQLLLLLLELGHLRLRLGDLPVDLSDLLEKVVLGGAQLVPLVDGGLGARGGDLLNLGLVTGLLKKMNFLECCRRIVSLHFAITRKHFLKSFPCAINYLPEVQVRV